MSSTLSTIATPATITCISKYRALFLVLASEMEWKFSQASTYVDTYTKGTEVITMVWGTSKLKAYSHTKGKNLVKQVEGQVASKLQKAQTSMGKPMDDNQRWGKLTPTEVTDLEALATSTFKVISPK